MSLSAISHTPTVDIHHDWVTTQLRPGKAFNKDVSSGPYDTLETFNSALKSIIAIDLKADQPFCTTCELRISPNATIPLVRPSIGPYAEGGEQDLPARFKTTSHNGIRSPTCDEHPCASMSEILDIDDGRERQCVQRAASRGIMQAIESVDGFKYNFNNTWVAKEERALRFSYVCQDSMQNRDRSANSVPLTAEGLRTGVRKPTYDCRGSVSMKFSYLQQRVVVIYRHFLIHASLVEQTGPASNVGMSQLAGQALRAQDTASASAPGHTGHLKRKRKFIPAQNPSGTSASMSLAALLRQSSGANARQPVVEKSVPTSSSSSAAVAYDIPSWQRPVNETPRRSDLNHDASPSQSYPPPYMPSPHPNTIPSWPSQVPATQSLHFTNPNKPIDSPKSVQKPTSQSLFTTMKPTRSTPSQDVYSQLWVPPNPPDKLVPTPKNLSTPSAVSLPPSAGSVQNQASSNTIPKPVSPTLSFAEWTRRNMAIPMPGDGTQLLSQWSQQQQSVPREESPDPWFPKRDG